MHNRTTRSDAAVEPFAVKPRQACLIGGWGLTRLYQLINEGELDVYKDGRSTLIMVASIKRRAERLLAAGRSGKAT